MYDWAQSVYFNTVLAAFLPGYMVLVATNVENDAHKFNFFAGWELSGQSYYSSVVPIAVIMQLICFVLFGTLGDFGGLRKKGLIFTSVLGSTATMLFVFVTESSYWLTGILLLISNVALGFSVILYNGDKSL